MDTFAIFYTLPMYTIWAIRHQVDQETATNITATQIMYSEKAAF